MKRLLSSFLSSFLPTEWVYASGFGISRTGISRRTVSGISSPVWPAIFTVLAKWQNRHLLFVGHGRHDVKTSQLHTSRGWIYLAS
jgi:hypothetical protein